MVLTCVCCGRPASRGFYLWKKWHCHPCYDREVTKPKPVEDPIATLTRDLGAELASDQQFRFNEDRA